MCILIYIHDIVWMKEKRGQPKLLTLLLLLLNGKRPRQREELACSRVMISENVAPRNS